MTSFPSRWRSCKKLVAVSMVIRETSTIDLPRSTVSFAPFPAATKSPTVTARLSGRSRSPLQAEQGLSLK